MNIRVGRRALIGAGGAGLVLAATGTARAQAWPSKPIRLVVPQAAGGGSDTIARFIGERLAAALQQSVVVENKPGAAGMLGAEIVKTSPADGYTILMANQGPMVVNPHLFKSLKVDPLQAFDPVTLITS